MAGSAYAWLGSKSIDGRMGRALQPLADRLLGRDFPANARQRVQIYYTRSRICFAQIFPFLHHETRLGRTYGSDIRYFDVARLMDGQLSPVGADVVMIQPWFDVDREALARALERIRAANPDARVIFLDSYAHNDLRLARTVDPFIDLYLKKSLFCDRAQYFKPTLGDTNLTDYYGWRHGCAEARVDWQVPRSILTKLRPSPHFFAAPGLMEGFLGAPPDLTRERPIDLHARLTTAGTGWYGAMRADCVTRAMALPGHIAAGTGVPHAQFLGELRASKMIFSPFGYGELCWRDIEGFLAGAVVVKQDMGHLETRPDLFRAWETYVPVAWDFSDLEENVARVQADADLRRQIASTAWTAIRRYLDEGRFVAEARELLHEDRAAAPAAPPAALPRHGAG